MDGVARIRGSLASWGGVVEGASKLGARGPAFFVRGREFVHFHAPTRVDVRMTRARIRDLPASSPCIRRAKPSDWVEMRVRDLGDWALVLAAARVAWEEARRPAPARRPARKRSR